MAMRWRTIMANLGDINLICSEYMIRFCHLLSDIGVMISGSGHDIARSFPTLF